MNAKGPRPEAYAVVLAEEQRRIDALATAAEIEDDMLMESAGRGAAEWIAARYAPKQVAVLAGPGGNGGDGLVVARCLDAVGIRTHTLLLQPRQSLSPEAARRLARLERHDGKVSEVCTTDPAELHDALLQADWVVDAMFGCGMNRPLGGIYRQAAHWLTEADVRVISLDLPSGLAGDRGDLQGDAVRADITLAMAFLKPAHLLFPARAQCGNVAVIPVDYPAEALQALRPWAWVLEPIGIRRRLPRRQPAGHKGTFGRVLVVAGSVGMSGAAMLCCRATLRAGAGLVTLAAPASIQAILEGALPEVITISLPDRDGHLIDGELSLLTPALERADVLAIGPGLSKNEDTSSLIAKIVAQFSGPVVIDADAIAAVAATNEAVESLAGRAVLTPHPGELSEVVGRNAEEIDANRRDVAQAVAAKLGCTLVLKGRPTAIALSSGEVFLNPTGNTGLATGGSGDVLTGLIAGLIAGGAAPDDAALAATYVHGLAAEVYARESAERSMTPSDLIELLPRALKEIERCG